MGVLAPGEKKQLHSSNKSYPSIKLLKPSDYFTYNSV